MQNDLEKFNDVNLRVVAISYDPVDVLAGFASKSNITFPLLSDADNKVMTEYELLNDTGRAKIAHPCTVLIGQDGTVKQKLSVEGYRNRHSTESLVEAAKAID